MTDEQMRIAIAEACGWEPYKPITHDGWPLLMTPPKKPNKEGWLEPIPDYLNNLNAMHEAEEVLLKDGHESDLWLEYLSNLVICAPAGLSSHATARQRCIAFLKTLNFWKD